MAEDCPFCRIVAEDAPAYRLYETERTLAFLDVNPTVTGHSLVIPKAHETGLETMDESTTGAVFTTVDRVADAMDETLDPDGFSVFHSTGTLTGRVEHAHVHLVPRNESDRIHFAPPRRDLREDEGERLESLIGDAL